MRPSNNDRISINSSLRQTGSLGLDACRATHCGKRRWWWAISKSN